MPHHQLDEHLVISVGGERWLHPGSPQRSGGADPGQFFEAPHYRRDMRLEYRVRDAVLRLMNLGHRALLTLSGGRVGLTFLGRMPVCKVTTTGRRTGRPRSVMLAVPVQRESTYAFVASKGGDDRDPEWYRNLVANPEITVEPLDGDGPIRLVARTASAEEKAELWPHIVAAYGGYERYQNKVDRDIPVVIAEAEVSSPGDE